VHRQFACRSCCREVRVECVAQVLTSAVGAKHLDGLAALLSDSPRLKRLVGLQSLVLRAHQVRDGEAHGVVCEGDEVLASLASGDGCRAPDIGVYVITEALCRRTDADLGDRQTSCVRENAGVAVALL